MCILRIYVSFFTNRDLNLFYPQWRLVFIFHFGVSLTHITLTFMLWWRLSLSSSSNLTQELCALSNEKIPFPRKFFFALKLWHNIYFMNTPKCLFCSIVSKHSSVFCDVSSFPKISLFLARYKFTSLIYFPKLLKSTSWILIFKREEEQAWVCLQEMLLKGEYGSWKFYMTYNGRPNPHSCRWALTCKISTFINSAIVLSCALLLENITRNSYLCFLLPEDSFVVR